MWSKGGEPLVTNWNNLLLLRSEEDRLTLAKTSERQVLAPFSSAWRQYFQKYIDSCTITRFRRLTKCLLFEILYRYIQGIPAYWDC